MIILAIRKYTPCSFFFFFNDTATTEIYTLSLHDALPICSVAVCSICARDMLTLLTTESRACRRSEEHTSELQSHLNLVCRLLLEKKKGSMKGIVRSHNSHGR